MAGNVPINPHFFLAMVQTMVQGTITPGSRVNLIKVACTGNIKIFMYTHAYLRSN